MSVILAHLENKPLQILIMKKIELSVWGVLIVFVLELEVACFMPLNRLVMTDLAPRGSGILLSLLYWLVSQILATDSLPLAL